MNPFLSFLLGGFLLGGTKETIIIKEPPKELPKRAEYSKCKACQEIGTWREDYGLYADDFCYEQYKKYKPLDTQVYTYVNSNVNRSNY